MIRHLAHNEIDKDRWDAALLLCPQRRWYMQAWVLDLCCPEWEALEDESSGAIMPLLWRRKWGVDYLYQPYGTQQQGMFAPDPSSIDHVAFLRSVPKRFRYWDINLNAGIDLQAETNDHLTQQVNQELLLDADIATLRAGYSQGHRRNLRKCGDHPPVLSRDVGSEEFIELFQRTTAARFGGVSTGDLLSLSRFLVEGTLRGQCRLLGMRSEGRLIAAACFMEWKGGLLLLKSANTDAGTDRQAMFHLVDAFIQDHAGTGELLDLGGSNTASVARFNAGFGARSTVYLRLVRNLLPPPLRWLKR